jgi:hypothetical protein
MPATSPLLPDEKQQLEARIAALGRQNKELKAKLVKLETTQKTKTKTRITASDTSNNNAKAEKQVSWRKVQFMLLPLRIVGKMQP